MTISVVTLNRKGLRMVCIGGWITLKVLGKTVRINKDMKRQRGKSVT